ncbi:MAG TPA: ABC transporter permease [Anaerolineaceae bacterium]
MAESQEIKEFKPIIITPPHGIEFPDFKEVWEHRDLLIFLVRRELKSRFQQTVIGVLWIALQPIIQMLIFYLVLGILVKIPTDNVPYPVFFLSGFIVWQFFSQIVNASAFSMLSNIGIIVKSYFPRLVLPLAVTISSIVDFLVSFVIILVLMAMNGLPITTRFFLLPVLLILTMLFASGVGLLFGALMVSFRDVKNFLGFILMIWMYITPIMYPMSLIPEQYRVYARLNPLTSLVETYRWVFLGTGSLPPWSNFLISFIVALLIWLIGAIYFRNMENMIADVM